MIVWGGTYNVGSSTLYNNGGIYYPDGDIWLGKPSTVNAPSARTDHTAIWTGSKMIVWGGWVIDGRTK